MQGTENIETSKACILLVFVLNNSDSEFLHYQGKKEKYTVYSKLTGVTKFEGQSILKGICCLEPNNRLYFGRYTAELTSIVCECAKQRDWHKMNRPRSLVLSIITEVGELAEVFQYIPDCEQVVTDTVADKASQELADIMIYLLQLVKECGVDLCT